MPASRLFFVNKNVSSLFHEDYRTENVCILGQILLTPKILIYIKGTGEMFF